MTDDSHPLLPKVMDLLPDPICVVDEQGRFVFVSAACERVFGYTQAELIGRNMIELVHPDDRERTLAAAAEIMSGDPKMHFQNRYVRKDGRSVDIMWSARWSEDDGIRLAVASDITALKYAERMRNTIYLVSEAAHAADSLPALYQHIHQIIADLLPADNFFVALYDQSGDSLSFPYFVDTKEREPGPQPLDAHALITEVIRSGHALLTTCDADEVAEYGYLDWLGVPLVSQQGIMGALVLKTYSGNIRYSEEDKELLQFISTQIAAAIERKRTETRLHHQAHHDALTDLPNRTLFYDRFDMALKRAYRDSERLALLCLDLDNFKEVNDTYGHDIGDMLLREVAGRLMQCVRDSDTVGRMGGDEFTVLLTNIHGPDDADLIAAKIEAAFSRPFELDGYSMSITASIGAAVYPEQGEGMSQLFRHADADMYALKRDGMSPARVQVKQTS